MTVYGYHRQQYFGKYNQNYPIPLIKIAQKYLQIYDKFQFKNEVRWRSFSGMNRYAIRQKVIDTDNYSSGMDILRYNAEIRILSKSLVSDGFKSLWRIKVNVDKNKKMTMKSDNFAIGIIQMRSYKDCISHSDTLLYGDGTLFDENDDDLNGVLIDGDGIKSGDIITVELDLREGYGNKENWGKLSFGVNKKWYENVKQIWKSKRVIDGMYKLYIKLMEPGINVKIIDYYSEK